MTMLKGRVVPTILAALLLLLVLVNILVLVGNQSVQAEVADRQQTIQQTMHLEALYRQVVAVLANMAVKTNDKQIEELLSSSGVDLGAKPGAPSGAK
jgi:predicted Holliday junction resolvase-like endonuclease